jgi:hypothetical protein
MHAPIEINNTIAAYYLAIANKPSWLYAYLVMKCIITVVIEFNIIRVNNK